MYHGCEEEFMAKRKGLTFYQKKKRMNTSLVKEIFSWSAGILISVFVGVVATLFFGMKIQVVGDSMHPDLLNGQSVYVDRFRYLLSTPKRGDVIVFLPNGNENAHYYVKRVVAVPGDHLMIRDGVLYVNGLESKWVKDYIKDPGIAVNDITLKSKEYFCMGDDPQNSEDSRSANLGAVEEIDIIGKVWFRGGYEELDMGLVK